MTMWLYLISSLPLLLILHCTSSTATPSSQEAPPPTETKSASFLAELILRNDCFVQHDSLQGISVCLKTKLLVNLNELIRSNRTVEISSFEFIKTKPLSVADNNSLYESLNEIPDETDERSLGESSQLTRLILKRVWQFLQTRSVRINNDSGEADQGRKKKDKGGMMMMMAMGMAGMMMQMMMMKVAMIAMKALVIGKIALILSGIIILKKLMSQGGGGGHGSSGGSSDWSSRRIWEDNAFAPDMAYNAYTGQ